MKKLISSLSATTKFTALALSACMLLLIGCGKDNQSNNNTTPVNPGTPQACAAGYYYYNNMCYPVGGAGGTQPPGFTYGNGFYADNYSGTSMLRVTNGAAMKDFFKYAMGVCDRAYINGGTSSCDSYIGGQMDIILQFPPGKNNSLLATIIAQPRYNPYYNYQYQLPSGWGMLGIALGMTTGVYLPDPKYYYGAYRNPLQLEMVVSAINNSQGFEARGYGDYWTGYNRTLLAIQVQQGKIEDNSLNFNFMIQGNAAAQGTFTRCRTQNCGL